MSSKFSTRVDYLDAARALALVLGVIFHASLSFMPMYIGWAVMDLSTSPVIAVFVLLSHSFRMELFFLIAGLFSHMTLKKKGGKSFIQSRLARIAVPFVVAWFVLRPLLVSGWVMGAESMRGDVNVEAGLAQGISSLTELPHGLLVGTHLWFLYYLLVISAIVLTLYYTLSHTPIKPTIVNFANSTIKWFCQSKLGLLTLVSLTALCLWFTPSWSMPTPDKSLIPDVFVTLIYGGFFLFGWLLYASFNLLAHFVKVTWYKFIICLIAMVTVTLLSPYEMQLNHNQYILIKAAFTFSYALMMWLLVSLSLGLCKRLFDQKSKLIRYVADSSYWLYLIHLPLVVWLQIAFAELPFDWTLKLACITVITIALSTLIYDACIRSTFIGAVLNGQRKPRVLFTFSKAISAKKDEIKQR